MEKSQMFETFRANMKWLEENYDMLKKEFSERWVIIYNKKIVQTASTFEELMEVLRKYDVNQVLVEYIRSERIAMFF